jgi:hypothetical protein
MPAPIIPEVSTGSRIIGPEALRTIGNGICIVVCCCGGCSTGDGSDEPCENLDSVVVTIIPSSVTDIIATCLTKLSALLAQIPTCIPQFSELPATLAWGISTAHVSTLPAQLAFGPPNIADFIAELHVLDEGGVRTSEHGAGRSRRKRKSLRRHHTRTENSCRDEADDSLLHPSSPLAFARDLREAE